VPYRIIEVNSPPHREAEHRDDEFLDSCTFNQIVQWIEEGRNVKDPGLVLFSVLYLLSNPLK
jgi:hypothetical protein